MRARLAIQIFLLPLAVWSTSLGQAPEKLPVPDEDAQKAAMEMVRNVFKADYEAARAPQERIALAMKILNVAGETKDDPAGRYALLTVAKDIAASQGELELLQKTIAQLAATFRIDELAFLRDGLAAAEGAIRDNAARERLVELALSLMDRAEKRDRYHVAKELAATALQAARERRSPALIKRVEAKLSRVQQIEEAYRDLERSLLALEDRPTDPDANLAVGKFYCFVKGQWDKGIPMLALGSDPKLRELAKRELQDNFSADDRMSLADGWWELAKGAEWLAATGLAEHAAEHYRKAMPNLSGLTKARVQGVLSEHLAILYADRVKPVDLRGKRANGVALFPVIACDQKAYEGKMGPAFDPSQSWSLGLEFLAPSYDTDYQMIFLWGDGRGGHDPLFVRLRSRNLEVVWSDARDNRADAFNLSLDARRPGEWIAVKLEYDREVGDFFVYLDDRLVDVKSSPIPTIADQPMPVWIGGADAGSQRFPGHVRKVWVGNTE